MKRQKILLAGLFAAFVSTVVAAQENPGLEAGLIGAMKYDRNSNQRAGSSGEAIRAYMKAGYVNPRPNGRADYTDYYLLNQAATFLGHPLVVIEEEYMTRYVGCCVSEGLGVTVKVVTNTAALKKFATLNRCRLEENVDPGAELRSFSIRNTLPKARCATLSCRERDAQSYIKD
ncbi:hypothetical protein IV454_13645 [Massilia antarctica]|uniref:Uncharacterized protein n=1 Tax=Massilia antarctica TaxID=2765360 RepID=A0AA48WJ67_9BURK|nr:hypothetical protein [Massilia antarctica]QPI52434.1 hypothetical protein IV454_13645 [Massilia antarctica]